MPKNSSFAISLVFNPTPGELENNCRKLIFGIMFPKGHIENINGSLCSYRTKNVDLCTNYISDEAKFASFWTEFMR